MEEPYRTDPAPPPPPVRESRWWQDAEWPSYHELKDLIVYVGLLMFILPLDGCMTGSMVGRVLGQVDKEGIAKGDFMAGGLGVGLVAGVVSAVWGTSRLRWTLGLGSLLAGALLMGGQMVFKPHP